MRKLGLACNEVIPVPLILENYIPKPRSEREPIVLHVGTRPSKRPDISVEAVKLLREWGYDVKLVIVGYYERRCDWVVVKEKVSDQELRELYSKALALTHPSTWEGFSYVTLEAQASGTPVVVGPGVPDEALISGRTGFKVASFDPRDYAEKLGMLLEDESLWKSMSRESRKYVEKFNHVKIAKRYIELYNNWPSE